MNTLGGHEGACAPSLGAWRRGLRCLLVAAGLVGVWFSAGADPVYLCPGNRFTNRIDAASAAAIGCHLASAGRVSLAFAPAEAPPSLPAVPASPALPLASAVPPASAPVPAIAPPLPLPLSTASPPARSVVGTAEQRALDSDAHAILQRELARTLASQQALLQQGSGPDAQPQLQRLRQDEAALRREMARLEQRSTR